MSDEDADSIPPDAFYRAAEPMEWPPRRHTLPTVPSEMFFRDPPPWFEEPSFIERYPARPVVFGATLLLLGVLGIVLQRGVVRQIVIGAPIFEEFAKFGLALVAVSVLRLRPLALRLPFAWASGAGFGVFEHAMDYASEPRVEFISRVAFHAGSAGLSMAAFALIEPLPDVRVRWASTLASSVCHWANNFGAIALAVVGVLFHAAGVVDLAWSFVVVAALYVLTVVAIVRASALRPLVARELERVFPPRVAVNPRPEGTSPTAPWLERRGP